MTRFTLLWLGVFVFGSACAGNRATRRPHADGTAASSVTEPTNERGSKVTAPPTGPATVSPTVTGSGEPAPLDCAQKKEDGAILVSEARADARRGYQDRKFSDRATSKDKPIEVCGFEEQLLWLTAMNCDDGSRPWGEDLQAAHRARQRAVYDSDSSCSRPVDVYHVTCPEREYDIYINVYVCPANEGVFDNWGPRPRK